LGFGHLNLFRISDLVFRILVAAERSEATLGCFVVNPFSVTQNTQHACSAHLAFCAFASNSYFPSTIRVFMPSWPAVNYAKQSQFPRSVNECKSLLTQGL
jgi:hypothetical protein